MAADAIDPESRATGPIDWPKLLNRFSANPGFIEKLARTTLASQRKVVDQLRDKARSRDLVGVGFAAHGLKSVAGYFEAARLFELARQIESGARAGDEQAFARAAALAEGFDALLAELEQRFPPPPDADRET